VYALVTYLVYMPAFAQAVMDMLRAQRASCRSGLLVLATYLGRHSATS
jgi:hypothetical protein